MLLILVVCFLRFSKNKSPGGLHEFIGRGDSFAPLLYQIDGFNDFQQSVLGC